MNNWVSGQLLNDDKYQIEDTLSIGGFGITYLAKELNSDRAVTIKTLNSRQQRQPHFNQLQQKFLNEALYVARCSHPHIVQVYEVFEDNGLWHMVMEYIEGTNLADYLEHHGEMPEEKALSIIHSLGEALIYIHSQGFSHRDIKPDNIMLRKDSLSPVLIDFGMARQLTKGKLKTNTCMGSECFAPIEQDKTYFQQSELAPSSDVYALAATLYVMLTLQLPFPAKIRYEGNLPLKAPKDYNPLISDRVNTAIMQGMALFSQDRPQSMEAWLRILFSETEIEVAANEDDLNPQDKMRYEKLRNLLQSRKWEEADRETRTILIQLAGREEEGWLRVKDINNLPDSHIRTLDKLWVNYSNGRFGFSIQRRIWQEVGGKLDYETECRLGDRVGWRTQGKWLGYRDLTFLITAPVGHLPIGGGWFDGYSFLWCPSLALLSRS